MTKYCSIDYEERDCILLALRVYLTVTHDLPEQDKAFLNRLIHKLANRFSDAKSQL